MTKSEQKEVIEVWRTVLAEKVRQYQICVKNDEIFEVKKQLRIQIREIEDKIADLEIFDIRSIT